RLLPHHTCFRCETSALLHDGRMLRLPGHRRWHRQPAGMPGRGARRHAHRDPAGQTGGGMTSATGPAKTVYDVVIVGAGPAGLAAAATTAAAGLSTLLLDENASPGGQIYRAVTTTPVQKRSILGEDYWGGAALVAEAKASGAEIIQGATVWS